MERLDVAGAIPPEAEIPADEDLGRVQVAGKYPASEVSGRLPRETAIEGEENDAVHAETGQKMKLLFEPEHGTKGSRLEKLPGVRIEGDDHGPGADLLRARFRQSDQVLMAAVHGVKLADHRDGARSPAAGELGIAESFQRAFLAAEAWSPSIPA